MILAEPYSDGPAMQVIRHLDPWDWMEAEAMRGAPVTHLQLFADWRALQPYRLASWVVFDDRIRTQPFALLAICASGQRGVANAALIARDHLRFRAALMQLVRRIRVDMPGWARENAITRIEARAWSRHPRASTFLRLAGFAHETDMPGFGPAGEETFRQFAWTDPALPRPDPGKDVPCA